MKRVHTREVTADGLARVTAVVAEMVESDRAQLDEPNANEAPLDDLIAKAAQVVARHASTISGIRSRGLAQQGRARESLRVAASGTDVVVPNRLDLVR